MVRMLLPPPLVRWSRCTLQRFSMYDVCWLAKAGVHSPHMNQELMALFPESEPLAFRLTLYGLAIESIHALIDRPLRQLKYTYVAMQ